MLRRDSDNDGHSHFQGDRSHARAIVYAAFKVAKVLGMEPVDFLFRDGAIRQPVAGKGEDVCAHVAPSYATSPARCQSSTRVSCRHSSRSTRVSATPKIPSLSSGGMFSPDDMISSAFARLQACLIGVSSSFRPLEIVSIFSLAFFFMTAPPFLPGPSSIPRSRARSHSRTFRG